jgi:O-acetylserine/cysteine efflux transporter
MKPRPSNRVIAICLGLFVAFLWSTSWVLIKFGLEDIPAISFAGLRYGVATLCLLPFLLKRENCECIRNLNKRDWSGLILLGVLWYAVSQGAQFLGLKVLPAMTVSLLLNMTPLMVSMLGVIMLHETPSKLQWIGMAINLTGVGLYFFPSAFENAQVAGIVAVLIGVFSNAFSSILGRGINRTKKIPVMVVTTISMGIGSILLLVTGAISQGIPVISLKGWGIILWLAILNTAIAFNLWNYTLRTITAMESSLINSTMLIQIALLAFFILGEKLSPQQWVGMAFAAVGVVLVQLRLNGKKDRVDH